MVTAVVPLLRESTGGLVEDAAEARLAQGEILLPFAKEALPHSIHA
jgi:hypothetical protein